MTFTYSKAFRELSSEVLKIVESSAELIILDRNRNMLRFTVRINNVKTLTSIYAYNQKLFHIIGSTSEDSNTDFDTFIRVSDSFVAK